MTALIEKTGRRSWNCASGTGCVCCRVQLGRLDPDTSDVDLLVDIGDCDGRAGRRFMRSIVALEDLMGRRIDVVTGKAVADSDVRRELDATAEGIHGTVTSQMAA